MDKLEVEPGVTVGILDPLQSRVDWTAPRTPKMASPAPIGNPECVCVCVCVCFLPIHFGHQVRWTYQPGSHRRKVTQDFSSIFFLRCVP